MTHHGSMDAATICGYYVSPPDEPTAEGFYCVRCTAWLQFGGSLPRSGEPGIAPVLYGSHEAAANTCRRCLKPLHETASLATFWLE